MFPTFFLLCTALLFLVLARARFYRAWLSSRVAGTRDVTGGTAALELLRVYRVHGVSVRCLRAARGDHYDPAAQSLCLSTTVYSEASLAAVAVAAHEVGHAVQHRDAYAPLRLRGLLHPLLRAGNGSLFFAMALAYVFRMPGLAWVSAVGLGCLSLPCLVSLVVELDASRRARAMLLETCLVPAGESGWLSAFLGLAWSTYLALSVAILSATTLSVLVAAHVAG